MSSPRAPRPRGHRERDRRGTRARPGPGGRRLLPAVPRRKAMLRLALRRGRDARSPGRGGTAGHIRSRRAPGILTFYTDTATSEKVFAGAGGTWLSPDAAEPGGAGLCLVWPRMVQVGCVYGAGKDESETAPKPCSSSSCSFARCPPGHPNFCSFTQLVFFTLCWVSAPGGHAGEGLWWPWDSRDGGDRVVPWQGLLCPQRLSQTKTRQAQGTESRASSVAVPLSPWVCVPLCCCWS